MQLRPGSIFGMIQHHDLGLSSKCVLPTERIPENNEGKNLKLRLYFKTTNNLTSRFHIKDQIVPKCLSNFVNLGEIRNV